MVEKEEVQQELLYFMELSTKYIKEKVFTHKLLKIKGEK